MAFDDFNTIVIDLSIQFVPIQSWYLADSLLATWYLVAHVRALMQRPKTCEKCGFTDPAGPAIYVQRQCDGIVLRAVLGTENDLRLFNRNLDSVFGNRNWTLQNRLVGQ